MLTCRYKQILLFRTVLVRVLPLSRTQTSHRTTTKITSFQSRTFSVDDLFYAQEGMDNTSPGAGLADKMKSAEFKRTTGAMLSIADPASALETYRSSAVDARQAQHEALFLKHNTEEGVCKLVKSFYPGQAVLNNPKAKELTDAISAHAKLAYSFCVQEKPIAPSSETVELLSQRPTLICTNLLLHDAFKHLLNSVSTTSGTQASARTHKLKLKSSRRKNGRHGVSLNTERVAKKQKYVPPSRSDDPSFYQGKGEVSAKTGEPKQKRGRKSGSMVLSDGTIQAPIGSLRPTPMKVSRGVALVSPECVSRNSLESFKNADMASCDDFNEMVKHCKKLEAELATANKTILGYVMHEQKLLAELKSRKNMGQLYLSLAQQSNPTLTDKGTYTEFTEFMPFPSLP